MSNSPYSPEITQIKKIFKWLNRWIVFVFRSGYGPIFTWPFIWGKIMVVENIGRKSGLVRYAPVNYAHAPAGDGVYCLSGFGPDSHWYRNILQTPQVAVWIGSQRIEGRAQPVANSEQHLDIYRQVLINSGFATPLFEGIQPKTASQETIRAMAQRSPLIHLQLDEIPSPRKPHPGDLAWICLTVVIGWLLLRPRGQRS